MMPERSPFRDVALDLAAALHRVLESAEPIGMIAGGGSEMRFRGCSVF